MTPADAVLGAVRALLPAVAGRAAEIERGRRVPSDLLDQLIAAGCFRLLLPASHGGAEADLRGALRVFETLAAADASVAWTVMIGAGSWIDLAAIPGQTFDRLFAPGRDVIVAGAFNPAGSISAADGGYRVSGRWSFASGCEHADWLFGNCVEGVTDGVPELRLAVFARDQVVIEDTWTVVGLSGTGSHHFRVDDEFVPAGRTCRPFADESSLDATIVAMPPPALFSLAIASVAIGIAQGALDDISALAVDKVPLLARGPLATNPVFHVDLAMADTDLRAARALLHETADAAWQIAEGRRPFALEERARIRAAAVWATDRAAAVVSTAYRSGGASSVYADCALQRRLRDVHALTQHFLVRRDTLATAGAILAGRDPGVMVF